LSNHVVSADTTNTFKDCLHKFWANQDVLYDYMSQISMALATVVS